MSRSKARLGFYAKARVNRLSGLLSLGKYDLRKIEGLRFLVGSVALNDLERLVYVVHLEHSVLIGIVDRFDKTRPVGRIKTDKKGSDVAADIGKLEGYKVSLAPVIGDRTFVKVVENSGYLVADDRNSGLDIAYRGFEKYGVAAFGAYNDVS